MISTLENALRSVCMSGIDAVAKVQRAGEKVQRGVLRFAEAGSWAMWDVYSLEGFEKWSKAAISQMRMLELIPSIKGVFSECLKTVQGQRDIIYASLVFSSTAEFIDVKRNAEGRIVGYGFKLPRDERSPKKELDWVKILYGVGNFFETGKFLQKYKVYSFSQCTQWAHQIGSIKLSNRQNWTVGNTPVLKTLCDTPKDFLVFFASFYTVIKCFKNKNFWGIENLLKLAGSVGKMVLISSADYMLRRNHMVALCVSDMVTTHASLFAFWIKRNKERESRGLYTIS